MLVDEKTIVRELIAQLAAEFLADRRGLIEGLVRRVHADPNVPADNDLRAATAEAGAQLVAQLLTSLRDGAEMSAAEPPPAAIAYAHEYAHRGIDLPVLLGVIRHGYAEFSGQWSERLGREAPPTRVSVQALSTSMLEIFSYIDSISSAFAIVYSAERERWSRSLEALRLDVVRAIIDGEVADSELAAQRLGHRLDGRHRAFVVWSEGEPTLGLRDALESAASELAARAGAPAPLLVPLTGQALAGGVFGEAADTPDAELCAAPLPGPFEVRAAIGTPGGGIEGFRQSHRQALHARRVAGPSAGVTSYRDVALAALASTDLDHAREFVRAELGALGAGDASTVRIAHTVGVYLQEGRSRARTSRRLGLHTNTIAYRLQRGAELLGHSLDERAAEVQVALALASLVTA